MPVASRVSLPENFYDVTSPELLLQPEPGYIFARLALLALGKDLPVPDALGLAGREVGGAGAPYASPESQRFNMNAGDLLGDAFGGKFEFDGVPGQTIRVNRPKYQDTTYTAASRTVAANSAISTVPISPGSEQVDLTIFRYAGPYDQANIRVAPYGIDAMDARMGVHKLSKIVGGNLRRDWHKFLDAQWVTYGESTVGSAPAASTRRGTPRTTTSPRPAPPDGLQHDRACRALARRGEHPLLRGDREAHPRHHAAAGTGAQGRRAVRAIRRVPPDVQPALPGVRRERREVRHLQEQHAQQGREQLERQRQPRPRVRSGPLRHRHGRRARVAPSTDDNYGETAKVIWIAYLAMQMFDSRFGVSVRTG